MRALLGGWLESLALGGYLSIWHPQHIPLHRYRRPQTNTRRALAWGGLNGKACSALLSGGLVAPSAEAARKIKEPEARQKELEGIGSPTPLNFCALVESLIQADVGAKLRGELTAFMKMIEPES